MSFCTINTDGNITPAPSTLTENGFRHYHPPDEMYRARGYLELVSTDMPELGEEETGVYTFAYVDDGQGHALQTWTLAEAEAEPEPTLAERVTALSTVVAVHDEEIELIATGLEALANG